MGLDPSISVIYSELVLSLYPVLIKTVDTNLFTQILSRFIVFPVLAIAFGSTYDFKAIWGNPYEAVVGILHNLLNLCHVAVSYISFQNLSISSAISLFYLYPIFNLIAGSLLFGESLSYFSLLLILVAFIGVYLISTAHTTVAPTTVTHITTVKEDVKTPQRSHTYGVIMGILAALTETMIFIFIRSNTDAQASPYYTINHLYPAGLAMLLGYAIFNKKIVDTTPTNWIKLLAFNGIFGFTGYLARFFAIPRIPTLLFSLLSFIGVAFGYVWTVLFTKDTIKPQSIVGDILIVTSIAVLRYFS